MPIGVLLKDARGLDDRDIVTSASHELQAHGEILVVKPQGTESAGSPHKFPMPPAGSE